MLATDTVAMRLRLSIFMCVFAVLADRSAVAQCGGGGMSCSGHSMSGHNMGQASHASAPSMAHSPTGHDPAASSRNHIRNQPLGVPVTSDWKMLSGHNAHGSAAGTGGNSHGWSSTPFGFRQIGPRLFTSLADPTIRGRASTASRASLSGHALRHGNGSATSTSRVTGGVDDLALVALQQFGRTPPSLLLRIPSSGAEGIPVDSHSTDQHHQCLTSDGAPDWAAKFRSQAQSEVSLPGSIVLRSQKPFDQTMLPPSRVDNLNSSQASHTPLNSSPRIEAGVSPSTDFTLGGASGTRPVFRSSLDGFSAIELPATRGLEDFMVRSHNVQTTRPGNRLSKQAAR